MPLVSVIIPVLHEPGLRDFLDLLYARFAKESLEVLVVDGDPEGGSIASVVRPDVITLVAKAGRGPQMNAGARASHGGILLFLHADTHLPDTAFRRIRETLKTDRYTAGAFTLRFGSDKKRFSLVAWGAKLRCRLTRIPYGDQALFMKRRYFFELGGYREIPVMEDIDLMLRLRKRGGRVRLLSEAVRTSPRRWEKEGVIRSLFRTWLLSILFRCGVSPKRLQKHYRPTSSG